VPSWNDLLREADSFPDDATRSQWLAARLNGALQQVSALRSGRNVVLYGSSFLQKPMVPGAFLQITGEDLNGFMAVIFGMDWGKGLTLILHTPGGETNAAESIVAYLRSKFPDVEVVVPTFAMSAGTMISLSADRIVMGRQSQLGPIDPQMPMPAAGRFVSARAIVDQFAQAKKDILGNVTTAHAWAPVLQSLGPALLVEAQNALDYGERMVGGWLAAGMFKALPDAAAKGQKAAAHFNDASKHKSHGRRIGRDEARSLEIVIEDLEDSQELQEAVLTAYHVMTIAFEKGPAAKLLWSNTGRMWVKNVQMGPVAKPAAPAADAGAPSVEMASPS
jgi:hypothetical protein